MSGRAMLDAMVAGERNPRTLGDLAKGSLVKRKPALIEALTGQFEDHHARPLHVLPATVDHLTAQVQELDRLIARTLKEVTTPCDRPGAGPSTGGVDARALAEKLDVVPGIGPATAQITIAEIGADMSRFPTPEHLVSWAKLRPRTIQSGAKNTAGPAGQGNPWLKGALGEAANAAARTDTFLGARYRRIVKRRGHAKALGRRRPLATRYHLAPDQRPRRLLPGTRLRLASTPPQSRTQDPRPRPSAPGPRPPGHPRTRICLTELAATSGPQAARQFQSYQTEAIGAAFRWLVEPPDHGTRQGRSVDNQPSYACLRRTRTCGSGVPPLGPRRCTRRLVLS